MILYDYFRSSACYRVRIALNLKNIPHALKTIHLVNNKGEQHLPFYHALNPQELVPTLEDNGVVLTQSLAIIDYLEHCYPTPALLPKDPIMRAHSLGLALTIACDMHPLNNLRVIQRLKTMFQASEEQVQSWYHDWLKKGFDAFESQLEKLPRAEGVCVGKTVSLADVCLVPQVYNARRFQFSLEKYPLIREIEAYCNSIDAFIRAAPQSP